MGEVAVLRFTIPCGEACERAPWLKDPHFPHRLTDAQATQLGYVLWDRGRISVEALPHG